MLCDSYKTLQFLEQLPIGKVLTVEYQNSRRGVPLANHYGIIIFTA